MSCYEENLDTSVKIQSSLRGKYYFRGFHNKEHMRKRIFLQDINRYHPYKYSDSTDRYYTALANKIVDILDNVSMEDWADDDMRRDIAVAMALYLEDVVSGTKIWRTFTEECKARYGVYVPFYEIDEDYCPDEINIQDVNFLLWHRMQVANEGTVFNPENIGIGTVSTMIMDVLEDAYEDAPENERMLEWMQNIRFSADDFLGCRRVLQWFHYRCYLFYENTYTFENQKDQVMDFLDEQEEVDEAMLDMTDIMFYGLYAQNIMDERINLLSFTTPQWADKILSHHTDTTPLRNLKVREIMPYQVISTDEKSFTLKSPLSDMELLCVDKNSLDDKDMIDSDCKYVACQLVWYGDGWKLNGMLRKEDDKEYDKEAKPFEYRRMNEEILEDTNKSFLKATGGERLAFCRDRSDMVQFMTRKMKMKFSKDVEWPDIPDHHGIVIVCAETKGVGFITEYTEAICSPRNPFYNKKKAEITAIKLLFNSRVAPYEVARLLWDNGYLPDAGLNSAMGIEYGKKFFADNADFLIDYFHHRCKADLKPASSR